MSGTLEKIQAIVGQQLGIESSKVIPESNFQKDLGADSLDIVELIMAFEEEFEIEVDDQASGEISTVQQVLDYIENN
uniref:Acyl carrier protein n=1 Tax=Plagiogrammopsis vanheurckii TaxID=1234821 RepID=A0A2U9NN40_9STRA|nr:acyl carrier protein [Plagiogrammopsis vanheurckii]AWT38512.1 acyl carrier protein [Plagiogrammopsis vanheurckii]